MIGPVETVHGAGSSERGAASGSGPVLGEYPHDDNGSPGAPGPVNIMADQHQGHPTYTVGPDEAGPPNIVVTLVEQVPVRDTTGEVQVL